MPWIDNPAVVLSDGRLQPATRVRIDDSPEQIAATAQADRVTEDQLLKELNVSRDWVQRALDGFNFPRPTGTILRSKIMVLSYRDGVPRQMNVYSREQVRVWIERVREFMGPLLTRR